MEPVEFAKKALDDGIGLYSVRLYPISGGFHFEIQLDGLKDSKGSVSLADCEAFSRRFSELLDLALQSGEDLFEAASGLREDNYTLEVSSAGIERELRLPGDLERFQGLPLKIVFKEGDSKKAIHGVFSGSEKGDSSEVYNFHEYYPVKGKNKKQKLKSIKENELIQISSDNIIRINLFLDF